MRFSSSRHHDRHGSHGLGLKHDFQIVPKFAHAGADPLNVLQVGRDGLMKLNLIASELIDFFFQSPQHDKNQGCLAFWS